MVSRGLLDGRRSSCELESGAGTVRPQQALVLASWIVKFEAENGRLAAWTDMSDDMKILTEKFSRWRVGSNDGQLMPILIRECQRLMSTA